MEQIELPAGLFKSICRFLGSLPGSAYGNTTGDAIGDLMNKLAQCKVTVVSEATETDKVEGV